MLLVPASNLSADFWVLTLPALDLILLQRPRKPDRLLCLTTRLLVPLCRRRGIKTWFFFKRCVCLLGGALISDITDLKRP